MRKTQRFTTEDAITRRLFLRRSLMIGAGVAGAITLPAQAVASVTEETGSEAKQEGYRMTEHIAEYYKSAEI